MRSLAIVLCSAVLAGCANPRAYVPPSSGPLSKIEFVNQSKDVPITVLFYEDGVNCKGLVRVSFYNTDYSSSSVVVSAGKPFTFTIDHSTGRSYCRQTHMFTPEEAHYRVRTATGAEECALVVEKSENQSEPSSNWIPVTEITRREYKAPLFQDGEWCEPL